MHLHRTFAILDKIFSHSLSDDGGGSINGNDVVFLYTLWFIRLVLLLLLLLLHRHTLPYIYWNIVVLVFFNFRYLFFFLFDFFFLSFYWNFKFVYLLCTAQKKICEKNSIHFFCYYSPTTASIDSFSVCLFSYVFFFSLSISIDLFSSYFFSFYLLTSVLCKLLSHINTAHITAF